METSINQLWRWASNLFHSVGHHGNLHQSVVTMSKWPISLYGSPWKPASISCDDKQVTYFILWVTMETCINQLWWRARDLFHSMGHHGNLHQSVVMKGKAKGPISVYGSPWKPASISRNDEQVTYFILWVPMGNCISPHQQLKVGRGEKGENWWQTDRLHSMFWQHGKLHQSTPTLKVGRVKKVIISDKQTAGYTWSWTSCQPHRVSSGRTNRTLNHTFLEPHQAIIFGTRVIKSQAHKRKEKDSQLQAQCCLKISTIWMFYNW